MRIALVDPSRTVLRIVKTLLESGGHAVHPFTDGSVALGFIQEEMDVRALITSAEPISISGIRLCAQARKLAGSRRPLYIILMSSIDNHRLVVQALDNGADDFIHKPPVSEELRARMRAAERLTSMQHELLTHATTDPLTGLRNRRAFFERAEEAAARAKGGAAISAIMVDIDRFKAVNDTHGHQAGDAVLRAVASEIAAAGGTAGRLGGEEFCILLETPLPEAAARAEHLRHRIKQLRFAVGGGTLEVTCSCGLAAWEEQDALDGLLRRADIALYQAKVAGRDRVVAEGTFAISDMHEVWRGVTRLAGRPV
jgi:diguanylate cyclase (GGDEF)-like protein